MISVAQRCATHIGVQQIAAPDKLGQVGAQGQRVAGQRGRTPRVAPAFPLSPDQRVDVPGGVGPGGRNRRGDPLDVGLGQSPGRPMEDPTAGWTVAVAGSPALMKVVIAGRRLD